MNSAYSSRKKTWKKTFRTNPTPSIWSTKPLPEVHAVSLGNQESHKFGFSFSHSPRCVDQTFEESWDGGNLWILGGRVWSLLRDNGWNVSKIILDIGDRLFLAWPVVWPVAGGRRPVAGGPVAGGRWPVAGGRWLVAGGGGRWPVAGGRRPVAGGPVAGGRWPVAGGRWPVAGGRWRWPVAGGRWPWPVAGGRWPEAGGRWPVLCMFRLLFLIFICFFSMALFNKASLFDPPCLSIWNNITDCLKQDSLLFVQLLCLIHVFKPPWLSGQTCVYNQAYLFN